METVKSMYDVNVFGLMETVRAFLPLLRLHGRGARILTVGSVAGWLSSPIHSVYSSTKFAVRALTDGLRVELQPLGIAVTNVWVPLLDFPSVASPHLPQSLCFPLLVCAQ